MPVKGGSILDCCCRSDKPSGDLSFDDEPCDDVRLEDKLDQT